MIGAIAFTVIKLLNVFLLDVIEATASFGCGNFKFLRIFLNSSQLKFFHIISKLILRHFFCIISGENISTYFRFTCSSAAFCR